MPALRTRTPRSSPLRLLALVAAAVVGLGLLGPASPSALAAPEPGKFAVTGTVTGPGGAPAEVTVHVYRSSSSGWWQHVVSDYSANGQVGVALSAGQYFLEFVPADPLLRREYYDNQRTSSTATPLTVSADVSLVPVALEAWPAITGRVVSTTGAPLGDVQVAAYQASGPNGGSWASDYTDADGTFRLYPPAGQWKLLVSDESRVAAEWFSDAATHSAAEVVTLGSTDVPVGDLTVSDGGSIRGRLITTGGAPVERVEVSAYDADGRVVARDQSNVDGRYLLPLLVAGTYKLRFNDTRGEHPIEWYADAATAETATAVQLAAEQHVTLPDAALGAGGRAVPAGADITGVVTNTAGRALMDARVIAYVARADGTPQQLEYTVTDRRGRYYFTGLDRLDPRQYRLRADSPDVTEPDELTHVGAWFGGDDLADADPVTVTPGQLTEGVDFALRPAAGLRGQLTDESGRPVRWGNVEVFDQDGGEIYQAQTDSAGRYSIPDLEAGVPHLLRFWPDEGVPEWHANATTVREARPVVLTAGRFTTVNAALADRLKALSGPAVAGAPLVGQRLTAAPGRWNVTSFMTYRYQWRRGTTLVGTGPTYTTKAADAGARLTLRVDATHDWYRGGTATVSTAAIRHASGTRVTSKAGRRGTVTLAITVASAVPASGRVTVRDGSRTVGAATVTRGRATLVLRNQKRGSHRYTAAYAGSSTVAPSTGVVAVRVRR